MFGRLLLRASTTIISTGIFRDFSFRPRFCADSKIDELVGSAGLEFVTYTREGTRLPDALARRRVRRSFSEGGSRDLSADRRA